MSRKSALITTIALILTTLGLKEDTVSYESETRLFTTALTENQKSMAGYENCVGVTGVIDPNKATQNWTFGQRVKLDPYYGDIREGSLLTATVFDSKGTKEGKMGIVLGEETQYGRAVENGLFCR